MVIILELSGWRCDRTDRFMYWAHILQQLLSQDERLEMTHAKVWQSIGKHKSRLHHSWILLHYGTASVKGKKNIEAGFVYHHIPK